MLGLTLTCAKPRNFNLMMWKVEKALHKSISPDFFLSNIISFDIMAWVPPTFPGASRTLKCRGKGHCQQRSSGSQAPKTMINHSMRRSSASAAHASCSHFQYIYAAHWHNSCINRTTCTKRILLEGSSAEAVWLWLVSVSQRKVDHCVPTDVTSTCSLLEANE